MSSRTWRWASGWTVPVLLAVMDAAWITPFALLVGAVWSRPGTPILSPVILVALLLGAQAATRCLLRHEVPLPGVRMMLVSTGIGAVTAAVVLQYGGDPWWRIHHPVWHAVDTALTSLRPELPAAVLAALAWGRGIAVGRTGPEYYDVESAFALGFVALSSLSVGLALGHGVPALEATALSAVPSALVFLGAGLLALPLARLRSVHQRTQAPRSAVMTGSGPWLAATVTAVMAVLGTALLAGMLLRLHLGPLLGAVGRVLDPVVWAVVYAVAFPIGLLVWGVVSLLRRLVHPGASLPPTQAALPQWVESLAHPSPSSLPPGAAAAARWGVGTLLAILLVLWLLRAVDRYGQTARGLGVDEERESVWSVPDLQAAWRARLGSRRRKKDASLDVSPLWTGATGEVRRAYATFLAWAASRGRPRAPHETPHEFARATGQTWPALTDSIQTLTAIYQWVRYGLGAPDRSALNEVRSEMARLAASLGPGKESTTGSSPVKGTDPPDPLDRFSNLTARPTWMGLRRGGLRVLIRRRRRPTCSHRCV